MPSRRTEAGYRLYTDDDLLRLQRIIISRELGLPLEAIRHSLDDPHFDRRHALRQQLLRRAEHTAEMICAIDAALLAIDHPDSEDEKMTDLKTLFNGFDHSQYGAEVKQRWGGTDGYRKMEQRTKAYTEQDWKCFLAESGAIYADAYTALQAGKNPDDPEVMDIAERHRLSIDHWFYSCSVVMHCGLADMYETVKRYSENIDKHGGAGLTKYLAAAIRANAWRSQATE